MRLLGQACFCMIPQMSDQDIDHERARAAYFAAAGAGILKKPHLMLHEQQDLFILRQMLRGFETL